MYDVYYVHVDYSLHRVPVWANRPPLFGRLLLRNPNSLNLADSLTPFSHDTYSIVTEGGAKGLIAVGAFLLHATDKSTHDLIVSRGEK